MGFNLLNYIYDLNSYRIWQVKSHSASDITLKGHVLTHKKTTKRASDVSFEYGVNLGTSLYIVYNRMITIASCNKRSRPIKDKVILQH